MRSRGGGGGAVGKDFSGLAVARQPAFQRLAEESEPKRLGQVLVHAGLADAIASLGCRVGRERQDRHARCPRRLCTANRAREVITVELGHVQIAQHERVSAPLPEAQRLGAVARDLGGMAEQLELHQHDLPVDRIVLGDQDQPAFGAGQGDRIRVAPAGRRPP